jgi:hypothetical protein
VRATQRFLTEIRRSHTVYAYVDIQGPNQEPQRLIAIDGEVNVDRTAAIRRGGNVKCVDPEGIYVPQGDYGLLTPYGTEVRPYRGVRYSDGSTEVYPLGVFRIAGADFDETAAVSGGAGIGISITMYDRSRTVARDKFTNVYTVPKGTNIVTAIKRIIDRTFPDVEYDAVSTSSTVSEPKVYDASDDPWEACTELAKSIGCEVYFDVEGRVVIAPPTDVDASPSPDFDYIENRRNTLTSLKKSFSDEQAFNGVIVTGASPGDEKPPVRAEAWDLEPSSPTYRYGPYGEVPEFVNDTNVKTVAEAQRMADSLLRQRIGAPSQLSCSAWTNPALEAGDILQIERPRMGVTGLYTLDAFNIPFRKDGTQNLTVRSRRTV